MRMFQVVFCWVSMSYFGCSLEAKPQLRNPSGIYGVVWLYNATPPGDLDKYNNDGFVANCEVVVYRARDRKKMAQVRANNVGRFTITVAPGKYIIAPIYPKDSKIGLGLVEERSVTVWRGFRTYAEATFDGGW